MPKQKTVFDEDWRSDPRFSAWLRKSSVSSSDAYCTACKASFSVANGGVYQVIQHHQGKKHINLVKADSAQTKLHIAGGFVSVDNSGCKVQLSTEDQISRAEILFLFRLVKHNHSFSSSSDLVPVLRAAFTDPVANGMTLGASKAAYSLTYGLGPFFHKQLVDDMKNVWYSLQVDETTSEQNVKQFDLHVRYWSPVEDKVTRRYFASSFLGHARADDLKSSIIDALSQDNLPLLKMLHLGCDGPNVNKTTCLLMM
jgi:hypothetical protein